jgi:nucleotide-binding universal stress UspA family protein
MYTQILAAIDGSDCGWRALTHTKLLAETFHARILLVHAFPHTSDLLSYDDFERLVSKRKQVGQTYLDEARERLGIMACEIDDELLEGPEAEAILTLARSREADLIVMGSRGLGTLEGLLLGSVSRKVMHYATCPVMIVR